MSDPQAEMLESVANQREAAQRAFGSPDLAAARAGATPQSMYVELMKASPVRDLGNGFYSVLRMDDIITLTRSKAVRQATRFLGSTRPAIPLGLDGHEHLRYRRLLDPVFTMKRVAPLEKNIRALASELIDRFIDAGRVDAYDAWCERLPSTIFLSIMGLPMKDLDDFLRFKNRTLSPRPEEAISEQEYTSRRHEAAEWLHDYFHRDLDVREQEGTPRDDMIGWLLTSEVGGARLSREEVLDIIGLLMIAGLDTVAASLACMLSYLARHPGQRARILANPEILPTAVEELMRFESPVAEGFRRVTEDVELPSGTTLPAGAYVHVSWSAANLDPDFFDDPLEVDLWRTPNRHIAFASGFHRCLGSHLARLELQTAMAVWHERLPDYRVEAGTKLVYSANPRAPHSLPLVWQ